MNILAWESCPFSLRGRGKSSPRSYLWSPSWQNVSNVCDVREVKTTMRRTAPSSFAFPRLVPEQKPTPCHSLRVMVHLLWFILSKLSGGVRSGQGFSPASSARYFSCNVDRPLSPREKELPLDVALAWALPFDRSVPSLSGPVSICSPTKYFLKAQSS